MIAVCSSLIDYLDPNVPEALVSNGIARRKPRFHTCNQWGDQFSAGGLDPHLIPDVQENIGITHGPKGKFAKIRMGGKIFQGVHLRNENIINHARGRCS
jgi:hypothetical protein